jgi:hypothetical protein
MAWLEGLREGVRLVGLGFEATHQAGVPRVRMLSQLPREVPVRMAGDHWQQKYANGGKPPTGLCQAKCTTLRREHLDDGNEGLILQGMKAG